MVFQVLLHHLFRDVAGAPRPIANRPEVSAPVAPLQFRVLVLELSWGSPLESFYQIWEGFRRRILDVYVDMVFANHAFEYTYIFSVADLHDQVSASHFDLSLQHVVAVFGDPYDVRGESGDTVAVMAVLLHSQSSTIGWDE